MEALESLGINPTILIAQIINFGIVLFVLYKFLYKPLLKLMDDRAKKIEKGVHDAERISVRMAEIEELAKKSEDKARRDALEVLRQAVIEADKKKESLVEEAKKQSQKIVETTRQEIVQEKKKIIDDVRDEIIDIVTLATKNAAGLGDVKVTKKMIDDSVESLQKEYVRR